MVSAYELYPCSTGAEKGVLVLIHDKWIIQGQNFVTFQTCTKESLYEALHETEKPQKTSGKV